MVLKSRMCLGNFHFPFVTADLRKKMIYVFVIECSKTRYNLVD